MGNCLSYSEIEGRGNLGRRWVSDDSVSDRSTRGSLASRRRGRTNNNNNNMSAAAAASGGIRHKGALLSLQSASEIPRSRTSVETTGILHDSGGDAQSPASSASPAARRLASPEPPAAEEMAAVLRSGKVAALAAYAGESDPAQIAGFLEDDTLARAYAVEQIIAEGAHWVLARVSRRQDHKQLLIKKIVKAKLPVEEQYFQPCESNKTCQCVKCAPWKTSRPPIELVLLQSRDSGMPQLVDLLEDERYYYLVTKLHGPSQKRWKHIWSWFGPNRWSTVYWREYLT